MAAPHGAVCAFCQVSVQLCQLLHELLAPAVCEAGQHRCQLILRQLHQQLCTLLAAQAAQSQRPCLHMHFMLHNMQKNATDMSLAEQRAASRPLAKDGLDLDGKQEPCRMDHLLVLK